MISNYNNHPASYQDQPINNQKKAAEIANALLKEGMAEGVAFVINLKLAKEYSEKKEEQDSLSKLKDHHEQNTTS